LLAHELGHALMARRHGLAVRDIRLWLLGGVSTLEGDAPSARAALQIAIVGPLTSLAIGVVAFAVALALDALGGMQLAVAACVWLASVNVILAVFNLLPGAPLDGGRVLRAVLWKRWGDGQRAAVTAARAGRVVGWSLAGLGVLELLATGSIGGMWLMILGAFIATAAQAEEMQTVVAFELRDVRVRDVMTANPVCAPASVTVDDLLHDYVMRLRCSTFPVLDEHGEVAGLATLTRMKSVPAARRATTLARDIAWPVELVAGAAPDELLLDVMKRATGSADGRVLVFDGDELVGIVSPTDIAQTLQYAHAAHGSPGGVGGTGARHAA
jgi:Zn-dependent protease